MPPFTTMNSNVIGLICIVGLTTVLCALYTGLLTCRLKSKPRPYPLNWCAVYVSRVAWLRRGLFRYQFLLAPNTVLFLIPILFHVGDQQAIALFSGIDLLCTIVLYALWKWTRRLIITAASYSASSDFVSP